MSLHEVWTHDEYNYPGIITALYARLSQEDSLDGERNSIANQKKILFKYNTDSVCPNPSFFNDDGVFRSNFSRTALKLSDKYEA